MRVGGCGKSVVACMIALISILLALASGQTTVKPTAKPLRRVVKVKSECSVGRTGLSTINVLSDFPVNVEVFCKNGVVVKPITTDGVTYVQKVAFVNNATTPCIFKVNILTVSLIYKVKVRVSWKTRVKGINIQNSGNYYTVTCSYGDKAYNSSKSTEIDSSLQALDEVIQNKGSSMKSDVSMILVNTLNRPMVGTIALGRRLRIQATVMGKVHVRPVSCWAASGNKTYHILVGGCGDGFIFKKTVGFNIKGKTIRSPLFSAFRLPGSKTLNFKCIFAACSNPGACDGSSCYKEKVFKDESLVDHFTTRKSPIVVTEFTTRPNQT
ncbi:vitelline envelope sperm lysin receptor-like [Haliotis rubra]|uniref:vitelline envelope sperm lysin receptor-like n=1 Tax=Haliotis rubra TaxID=36100 RepID=UPI001EE54357|nr:vitelline envelope sperm lysin receptor-like [Haliotis rubra]